MKVNLREKGKYKLVIFTLVLCSILLVSAYAVTYMWSAPITVAIQTSSPYIKVYYKGEEVTSLDLGDLVPGTWVGVNLIIGNTHPSAGFYGINWGSTLSNITDKITDSWSGFPLYLEPGEEELTGYYIWVASDCPLGTYTWTLYMYGPE